MKKRWIYSLAGTALCAALLVLSMDITNTGNMTASGQETPLREVTVIKDTASEGPGVTLSATAPETEAPANETEAEAAETKTAQAETEAATAAAETKAETEAVKAETETAETGAAYADGEEIGLDPEWEFASFAAISSGKAVYYRAEGSRKGVVIAVNAGHGTEGGSSVKTYCHPDMTPKVTGGTTAAGATKAVAVSSGMTFRDGTPEKTVTLRMARILRDRLLSEGYDVLMLRDGEDVQLDNVARTVIANNAADCHIALHWDSDGLSTVKGCFYMSVPDGLKSMYPVSQHWQEHEKLGDALIEGLRGQGLKIWGSNPLDMDLTQTSYSTIPSIDIELGNQCSSHTDEDLAIRAEGLVAGINAYFGY